MGLCTPQCAGMQTNGGLQTLEVDSKPTSNILEPTPEDRESSGIAWNLSDSEASGVIGSLAESFGAVRNYPKSSRVGQNTLESARVVWSR